MGADLGERGRRSLPPGATTGARQFRRRPAQLCCVRGGFWPDRKGRGVARRRPVGQLPRALRGLPQPCGQDRHRGLAAALDRRAARPPACHRRQPDAAARLRPRRVARRARDRQRLQPALWPQRGTPCPDSPNDLWSSPEPWKCVAAEPGTARPNQISAGLNSRIWSGTSPDQRDGKADIASAPTTGRTTRSGDPRVVYVVVTPFGSFAGSGNTTVPVVRLAALCDRLGRPR